MFITAYYRYNQVYGRRMDGWMDPALTFQSNNEKISGKVDFPILPSEMVLLHKAIYEYF